MAINQISNNGFEVLNIFSDKLISALVEFMDSSTPTCTRTGGDGIALREVRWLPANLYNKVTDEAVEFFTQLNIQVRIEAIELWSDYPNYTNDWHIDSPSIKNIIIAYLDNSDQVGTEYKENEQIYSVAYKKNSGLLLCNSNQVPHGMIGKVRENSVRRVIYITWSEYE